MDAFIAADRPPVFEKITPKGAAIEVRIYAENPIKDFLPSPGQITDLHFLRMFVLIHGLLKVLPSLLSMIPLLPR